jgi:putative mRNA 3-end processing factor
MEKEFITGVKEVIDNEGVALIPVFAVGRSQEILALLYKNGLVDMTYIDGMAKKASDIALRHPTYLDNVELLQKAMERVVRVDAGKHRNAATDGGNIILTTSGMLTGGPVLNYIRKLNRNSKVFLTGYQVEGTNGRNLLDGKPLMIDGHKFVVKNPVEFFNFSAHSDKKDLHEYIKKSDPEKVICVHGSAENTEAFAQDLKLEGFDAYAPKVGDTLKFDM